MSTSAEAFASAEPMVHITGLHKEFGPLHILKGIDLDVAPGEVCVLLGPSGSGKSPLFRRITCRDRSPQQRRSGLHYLTAAHFRFHTVHQRIRRSS